MTIRAMLPAVFVTAAVLGGVTSRCPAVPDAPVVVRATPVETNSPTTRPSTQADARADDIEHRAIGGARPDSATGRSGGGVSDWVGPTWWALALVIGLIFAAAWAVKRFGPNAVRNRPGSLFRVLTRWHLSSRQYVSMVQVGRRVLLLGVTGQQINLLAEVTDPAEIEQLMAGCAAGRSILSEGFGQLLGRKSEEMSDAAADAPAESAGRAVGQLGQVISRLKSRLAGSKRD